MSILLIYSILPHPPLSNEVIINIGKKYNKKASQVILRWLYQRNIISIPKSVHKERIIENFNIYDYNLSEDDMNSINSLNENIKLLDGEPFYFTQEEKDQLFA